MCYKKQVHLITADNIQWTLTFINLKLFQNALYPNLQLHMQADTACYHSNTVFRVTIKPNQNSSASINLQDAIMSQR